MEIRLAAAMDKKKILKYDCHIHHNKVGECICNGLVDILCDGDKIVGVLRWNLFWQSIIDTLRAGRNPGSYTFIAGVNDVDIGPCGVRFYSAFFQTHRA